MRKGENTNGEYNDRGGESKWNEMLGSDRVWKERTYFERLITESLEARS